MNISLIANRIEIAFWTWVVTLLHNRRLPKHLKFILPGILATLILIPALAWAYSPSEQPTAQAAEPFGELARPSNGQSNLLVVMVDRLEARQPQLQAAWVLGRLPSMPQVTFVPVFPLQSTDGPSILPNHIPTVFIPAEDGGLPVDFTQALKAQGLWWDNHMVIDQQGLAQLVDLMGGLEFNGRMMSGRQVAAELPNPRADTAHAWSFHLQLAQKLCARSSLLTTKASTNVIVEFSKFALSDLPPERLQAMLRSMQGNSGIACNFPTVSGR